MFTEEHVNEEAISWPEYWFLGVFDQHVVTSSSFPYYLPLTWIPPQLPPQPHHPQRRHIHRHRCSCRHLTLPWIPWEMSLLIKVMSSQMVIIADSEKYYLDSFHFQGENGDAKGFCLSAWLPLYVYRYVHDFLDAFCSEGLTHSWPHIGFLIINLS